MRFRYWVVLLLLVWVNLSMAAVAAASDDTGVKITGVRWSRTMDAVTGLTKVRLTVETSGPVEVDPFLTASPNWRIINTFRGVKLDRFEIPPSPDVSVVTKMSLIQSGKDNFHIAVDLPGAVNKDQYTVFALPADPKTKSPFRVVFEVQGIVKASDLQLLPGLKDKLVVIDPGHGGSDPGAIGVQGTREKQVNLVVAMLVKANLEKAGAKVLMTRETDIDVAVLRGNGRGELQSRTVFANANRADVFISVHHNAALRPTASGTGTYYYPKTLYDGILAGSLQEAMVQAGGLANYGVRTANFYVVKNVTMPAALLEIGFLSNAQEEQILTDPDFQRKIAQGIVTGIDRFFIQAAKMRGES